MKLLYCENLTHVHQIWLSYDRPTLDVDGSLHHNKTLQGNHYFMHDSIQFLILIWELFFKKIMLHHIAIHGDTKTCVQCQIHQGMHEYSPSFEICFPFMGDGFCWMGEMQHFGWHWGCADSLPTSIGKSTFGYLFNMKGKH
jgi:hypothetical protein